MHSWLHLNLLMGRGVRLDFATVQELCSLSFMARGDQHSASLILHVLQLWIVFDWECLSIGTHDLELWRLQRLILKSEPKKGFLVTKRSLEPLGKVGHNVSFRWSPEGALVKGIHPGYLLPKLGDSSVQPPDVTLHEREELPLQVVLKSGNKERRKY